MDFEPWLTENSTQINGWWDAVKADLVSCRESYTWPPRASQQESLYWRKHVADLVRSDVKRSGTMTRHTVEEVLKWGFGNAQVLNRFSETDLDAASKRGSPPRKRAMWKRLRWPFAVGRGSPSVR